MRFKTGDRVTVRTSDRGGHRPTNTRPSKIETWAGTVKCRSVLNNGEGWWIVSKDRPDGSPNLRSGGYYTVPEREMTKREEPS